MYLFHTTFGHHGLFSLTPMWLLIPFGVWAVWNSRSLPWMERLFDLRVQVMLAIVATSLVCFCVLYGSAPRGSQLRWRQLWFPLDALVVCSPVVLAGRPRLDDRAPQSIADPSCDRGLLDH